MRFTVQALEEGPCAAGGPHVLQIKLLGDDSREPSSWKLFADGACVADGSGAFARECFCEGAEVFLDLCRDAVRVTVLLNDFKTKITADALRARTDAEVFQKSALIAVELPASAWRTWSRQ